jgi:hypothetical protein
MNLSMRLNNGFKEEVAPGLNKRNPLEIVGRSGFLFSLGAVAVTAGLLFPKIEYLVDIFMIFSICLTGALVIISFSAKKPLDVTGLPLFVVLITSLRVFLGIIGTRFIVSKGYGGAIGDFIGESIPVAGRVTVALVFCIFFVVIFFLISRTARAIVSASSNYISEIFPVRQLSIDADLKAGLIKQAQALELRRETAYEGAFFVAMTGTARFIIFSAFLELFIAMFNVVGTFAAGAAGGKLSDVSAQTYASSVFGAGLVTHISALLAVSAAGHLVRKTSNYVDKENRISEDEFAERIKVVASEVHSSEVYDETSGELWYPDTVTAENDADSKEVTSDLEWVDPAKIDEDEKAVSELYLWQDLQDEKLYDQIAGLVEKAAPKKSILMTAERVEDLGVTLPVNVAMRLARRGRKTLVVDFDLKRNSIAKVFDLNSDSQSVSKVMEKYGNEAMPTCIRNLRVWPADWFNEADNGKADNLAVILDKLKNQYDHLIFYAPNMSRLIENEQITESVEIAMFFRHRDANTVRQQTLKFYNTLLKQGCKLINPTTKAHSHS